MEEVASDSKDWPSLQRFVVAQQPIYPIVLAELRAGRKYTHWMWYIFPQVMGLGRSLMAQRYAIQSEDEAYAYLAHPILGPRLIECTQGVLEVSNRSALDIFGSPDDMKFRSCMTLFDVLHSGDMYSRALVKFFNNRADQATIDIITSWRTQE